MTHVTTSDDDIFLQKIYPHFQKICTLRRPPGGETEIIEFIQNFARGMHLKCHSDAYGNTAVFLPPSTGLEEHEPLLFQAHMDMVCVPDKNIFPIRPVITEGWIHTEGTTLGADNGLAVAMMLALMEEPPEKHPPLEFLFTTREEVGLLGASMIENDKLNISSPYLINLDSEEIKYITVGCAGGQDMTIHFEYTSEPNHHKNAFVITVTGPGGHSGLQIDKNIPNAIKLAAATLVKLREKHHCALASIKGGFARNAIPAETRIVLCSDNLVEEDIKKATDAVKRENHGLQPFQLSVDTVEPPETHFTQSRAQDLLTLVRQLPHGVIKFNPDTGGVLSSVNLATISTGPSEVHIDMNARSSDTRESNAIAMSVDTLCSTIPDALSIPGESYPGWRPDMNSELLKKTTSVFESVRKVKPDYLDIHAGLECGILMEKLSSVREAISIGPKILNAHSVEERAEIATTLEIWDIIVDIIENYSDTG